LTHYNLYTNARAFVQLYNFQPQDRFLMISPLFQAASQTCLLNAAILSGATLIIKDGWVNPKNILTLIQNYQITYTFGPPTLYDLLLNHPEALDYNLNSWKIAVSSGAALTAETFFWFKEKFGIELCEVYGLTETSPLVCCNFPQGLKKPGSTGLPLPGVEVKVVDYEENELDGSNVGEIIVRGSNIMKGYYQQEEATELALRGQWLHTGDFGYKDSDGYLYIMDKKKDIIIRGGFPVYPQEVEGVLYQHPFVMEAAVTGVPDPLMGEEVLAFILLREGKKIAPEDLQSFCRDKIAMYKIPKYVKIVDNIPKNLSGKLLRGALQEMIPADLED
ncbi:MAG: AMP-binding protein, partial [Clostridia bacterium]|nr:AMP-binding protein [Clostridia bacterium]